MLKGAPYYAPLRNLASDCTRTEPLLGVHSDAPIASSWCCHRRGDFEGQGVEGFQASKVFGVWPVGLHVCMAGGSQRVLGSRAEQ